jgi:hypothetical protein
VKSSKKNLLETDSLLTLVRQVEPTAILKYNKYYIGLEVDGSPRNFVTFRPKKAHVVMTLRLTKEKEIDDKLEEAGIDTLTYEARWRQYRIRLESTMDEKQREVLLSLIKQAWEGFGK